MTGTRLLLATRNEHKAAEIRRIIGHVPGFRMPTPSDLDMGAEAEEDEVERFQTFLENATAKATYFAERSGIPALADDSGLVVDALDGAPGVRSKRFAQDAGATRAEGIDAANNDLLLERLSSVPESRRTARFVCAAALVSTAGLAPHVFVGTCSGRISYEPMGDGGFGYDPLFLLPELGLTTAQIGTEEKNRRSHRGRSFRAVASRLPGILPTLDRAALSS